MTRSEAIAVALIIVPVPLVFIVALLRGYVVHITFTRNGKDRQ